MNWESCGIGVNKDGVWRSVSALLAYPDIDWEQLQSVWPELGDVRADIREQIEIDALYAGYMDRHEADIKAFRKDENLVLPTDLDYGAVGSLSNEVRQKLEPGPPRNFGGGVPHSRRDPGGCGRPAALHETKRAQIPCCLMFHVKPGKNWSFTISF